ncbi:hypothetical protein BJ742DRAFT_846082 [Cladochytrium replicatum]|nr:hypothetical protein BJ742DRAFT_846082 [Cladochytrium replicatum]
MHYGDSHILVVLYSLINFAFDCLLAVCLACFNFIATFHFILFYLVLFSVTIMQGSKRALGRRLRRSLLPTSMEAADCPWVPLMLAQKYHLKEQVQKFNSSGSGSTGSLSGSSWSGSCVSGGSSTSTTDCHQQPLEQHSGFKTSSLNLGLASRPNFTVTPDQRRGDLQRHRWQQLHQQ